MPTSIEFAQRCPSWHARRREFPIFERHTQDEPFNPCRRGWLHPSGPEAGGRRGGRDVEATAARGQRISVERCAVAHGRGRGARQRGDALGVWIVVLILCGGARYSAAPRFGDYIQGIRRELLVVLVFPRSVDISAQRLLHPGPGL